MAKYDMGDIATYYFIVVEDGYDKRIHAWTDSKSLAKYYLKFHNCDKFIMKVISDRIENIAKILNENIHDEIKIHNIMVKDENPKNKGKKWKLMSIPATETEYAFINEETNTFMASRIDYGKLNEVIPYLKEKYQTALKDIMLIDIIKKVVHGQNPKNIQELSFDQLMILIKSFPDNFG